MSQSSIRYAPEVTAEERKAFLADISAVYRKHGLSLSWCCLGGFQVGALDKEDVDTLMESTTSRRIVP